MEEKVILQYQGQSIELPVVEGTENEKAIDIAVLRDKTGYITLDYGYKNTGSTQSAITFLDGEEGILRYRGYSIEQLAENSTFLEVAYLLIYGELPNKEQQHKWVEDIRCHTLLHEDIHKILSGFPANAHPMGVVSSLVCSLAAFYPESITDRSKEYTDLTIVRLLAKMPTFVAWVHKQGLG